MKIVRAVQRWCNSCPFQTGNWQAMRLSCRPCPRQWHGLTDDDVPVYLFYRLGWGVVCEGNATPEVFSLSDDPGQEMTLAEFCRLAGIKLALVDQ